MKKQLLQLFTLALFMTGLTAAISVEAQTRPYRVSDRQVQTLLNRIETKTDAYKNALDSALDQSRLNDTNREDNINEFVSNFENSTDSLRQNFDDRKSVSNDVQEVLNQAAFIDRFMRNNRLNSTIQRNWRNLRTDLSTLAGYYSVSFDLNTQPTNTGNTGNTAYRASDRDVQNVLAQLEQRTDIYKREMNNALDRSSLNNTRSEETIFAYITEFEKATDRLKQNFDARRSTTADVQEVLNRGNFIDGVMRDYRFTAGAENQWRLINTDLAKLSNFYNISSNFDRPIADFDARLTGTYRLNTSQSDDVNDVVGRATGNYQANQRDNMSRNLQRRLASPELLAIEKRNAQVTIASSNSPQITFDADGVARTETTNNGRSVKITATTTYDGVGLNYEGDRMNDFYVNFIPQSNGQLRVIRRIYLENRNETITVASVYDKTDRTARFDSVNNNNNQNTGGLSNDFIISNNTKLTAVLRTPISTKTTQNGDRFRMEISSPSQFDGAIIEGRIAKAERSGKVSGRANVSLEFDTIRLRNGRTYKFAGIVDEVTLANGDKIAVNNEGTVRESSQTTKTVTRAGIGAGIGAIIGAIVGGGSGAAIGAGIGAGAGAGTVILQGRDDIELNDGTQFSITASAPNNVGSNR